MLRLYCILVSKITERISRSFGLALHVNSVSGPLVFALQSSLLPSFKFPAALIFHLFSLSFSFVRLEVNLAGTLPAELVCCHTQAANDWGYWEAISMWPPPNLAYAQNFKHVGCALGPRTAEEKLQETHRLLQRSAEPRLDAKRRCRPSRPGWWWMSHGLRMAREASSGLVFTYSYVDTWTKVCKHVRSWGDTPSCAVAHTRRRGRFFWLL